MVIPDILGEAASLMQSRAKALIDMAERDDHSARHVALQQRRHGGGEPFRAHFAAWTPEVALAVADWLGREESAWQEDWDSHWLITARAWDKNNNKPMSTEVHQQFRDVATEFADGQHRRALAVARAYLEETP